MLHNATELHHIADRLKHAGLLPTSQRVRIATAIAALPQHFSAQELQQAVNRDGPEICRATIYNSLRLFVAHGLLQEVHVDPQRTLFDTNTEPHHHLFDPATGALHDLPLGAIELKDRTLIPGKTRPEDVAFIVRIRTS